MPDADFLVVGLGLAGGLLAFELDRRGARVMVIDDDLESASKMAAGLVNPIPGRRFAKTPGADVLLPAARDCYTALERFFKRTFYHEKNLWRIFKSPGERELFGKRLTDPGYRAYLQAAPGCPTAGVAAPYGLVEQRQTGYLAVRSLLDCLKGYFAGRDRYLRARFGYDRLQLREQPVWQGLRVRTVVFCEGYRVRANPWFGGLPWQALKGEILTLRCKTPLQTSLPDRILNNGHWLLPLTSETFRFGASFERGSIDPACTRQAREALLTAVSGLAPALRFQLCAHHAGIRPATLDRMPLLGRHPRHHCLAVFNGFGAKGSLLIPWHARHFADFLTGRTELADACALRRHAPVFTD